MGQRRINGVHVDLGIRMTVANKSAFWHPLSLHARNQPNAQIARAKAVALEIRAIREHFQEYRGSSQLVAIQSPGPTEPKYVRASVVWLKHGADDVLVIHES